MMRQQERMGYRITSAIPGRVRIQFPQLSETQLHGVERRLVGLPGVSGTRLACDASSVILTYDRRQQEMKDFLGGLESFLEQAVRPDARTRAIQARRAAAKSLPAAGSLVPDRITSAGKVLGRYLQLASRRVPGQSEILHAMNLANERPAGLKPLLVSTLAVALAAMDGVPLLITGAVLALAAVPIAGRAAKGLEKRQLTVDTLDLVNIALVALGGRVLPASMIAWLVSATELLRGKAVGYSRQSIARLLPPDESPISEEVRQAIERIYAAELSNSRFQDEAMRAGNATTYPLFILALVMYAFTRDIGIIISILKPRTDYTAGLRFGIPVPILNAMIANRQHGPLITSAAALENLTLLDAVLLTRRAEGCRGEELNSLEEALGKRGIRLLPLEDSLSSGEPSQIRQLKRQGFRVGVVGTMEDVPMDRGADIRILLDDRPDLKTNDIDVFLMESGLQGLIPALEIAWEAARICKQNTGLYGGAALTNLTTALLGVSPAPLSSLINAATMAATGGNSLRPLLAAPKRKNVRRLPEVLPARGAEK